MRITEDELEERAIAPRVSLKSVEESILFVYYFTAADGVRAKMIMNTSMVGKASSLEQLTFCVLVLKNGFTVTGESACADPKNFQEDIGKRVAYQNALNKIWPLLGYELKTKLSNNKDGEA